MVSWFVNTQMHVICTKWCTCSYCSKLGTSILIFYLMTSNKLRGISFRIIMIWSKWFCAICFMYCRSSLVMWPGSWKPTLASGRWTSISENSMWSTSTPQSPRFVPIRGYSIWPTSDVDRWLGVGLRLKDARTRRTTLRKWWWAQGNE